MCTSVDFKSLNRSGAGLDLFGGIGGNFLKGPKTPTPPEPPPRPQAAKAPDTAPLKRRNAGSGFAVPAGSTLLTGPNGITADMIQLGSQSLLGGG